jgi:hypothetical protein
MLSGGKDSVLMIHDLLTTHPGLRILCITYDDGFLEDMARRNVHRVAAYFRLDNLMIRQDCRKYVEAFLKTNLPQTVDIYTFLEVFQNIFWGKVQQIAQGLGNLPVITGNLGYFSSETMLPEQFQESLSFLAACGLTVPIADAEFISYWVEEPYPTDHHLILEEIKFESEIHDVTDNLHIRDLRIDWNGRYPKQTLDSVANSQWGEVTRPRFSDKV